MNLFNRAGSVCRGEIDPLEISTLSKIPVKNENLKASPANRNLNFSQFEIQLVSLVGMIRTVHAYAYKTYCRIALAQQQQNKRNPWEKTNQNNFIWQRAEFSRLASRANPPIHPPIQAHMSST